MTTIKFIKITALFTGLIFLSAGCSNEVETESAKKSVGQVKLRMELASKLAENLDNEIATVDVYSFWKKTENSGYTWEKTYQNIKLAEPTSEKSIQLTLDGSTERVLYLIANKTGEIPFTAQLNNNTAESEFQQQMILHNDKAIQAPLLMVSKQVIPAKGTGEAISVKFDYSLACLDIDNQYEGFSIDSLVVKDAVCGTYLFTSDTPTPQQVARSSVNYGAAAQICIYQTDASTLAIYGKQNGNIRAVFDIPLNTIQKASRYKVTFRNEIKENNLKWNISQWKNGTIIESSPDWTDNK